MSKLLKKANYIKFPLEGIFFSLREILQKISKILFQIQLQLKSYKKL